MDVSNLCDKISEIYATVSEQTYISNILRTISSGGDSSFTNKVGRRGRIIPFSYHNNNPTHLFARSLRLCQFMSEIDTFSINKECKRPLKLYRAVHMEPFEISYNPIPFSTSWNRDFTIEWAVEECCILEITVKFDSILPLSLPSEVENPGIKQIALNQAQEEVVLPPCRFEKKSGYTIVTPTKTVNVIVCDATRLTPRQMIEFYPDENKEELIRAFEPDDSIKDGWINKKLLSYYESETAEYDSDENEEEPEWA